MKTFVLEVPDNVDNRLIISFAERVGAKVTVPAEPVGVTEAASWEASFGSWSAEDADEILRFIDEARAEGRALDSARPDIEL